MDFLRDPIWQFVGAILGLIAIIITWIVFRLQTQRKSLTYEIITNAPLVGMGAKKELGDSIQISYKGKNLEYPRLVELRILNSGNSSITSSDFETPIKIFFQDSSKVIDVTIVSTIPPNIGPIIKYESNCLSLEPILLNKGDEIRLKTLINSETSEINFSGRIVGVKEIKSLGSQNSLVFLLMCLVGIYAVGGVAGAEAQMAITYFFGFTEFPVFLPVTILSLGIASTIFAFFIIFSVFSRIRKGIYNQ